MGEADDRRKYQRIDTGHVISVAPLESRDRLAVSKNLSRGGIRFEVVGCELSMEDVIRVTFNLDQRTVVAVGKVVWATDVDPITTDVGLEFIEIDPLALRLLEEEAVDGLGWSFAAPSLTPRAARCECPPMADFHQTGVIATLHRLGRTDLTRLEEDLRSYASVRPVALVLPCLASEADGPALKGIVDTLGGVRYLRQVVVAVSGTTRRDEYDRMRRIFEGVRTVTDEPATLVWTCGPRLSELYDTLRAEGLDPGEDGKGRSAWIAYGYVHAANVARVIAIHDCDILDYSREMLARLCFPTANPNLGYEFAKGYYGRVTDRLHGRVTRLFVTPLLRAMKSVLGPVPLLEYLDSFRYPLAGECSMTTDLARINRVPSDWGLEVGLLAEVYRNSSLKRICQVELAPNYDHKHRELSPDDPTRGLHRMVVDIASSLIRNLASYGVEFESGFLNTLIAAYLRTAQDAIARYSDDAALNGLHFDRHEEEVAVETFSRALRAAGLGFVRDPMGAPPIPNWSRVTSALPDFLGSLAAAVEEDMAEGV